MNIEQLDYELPPELIAQQPIEPRDHARLLVVDRATGTLDHRRFDDLPELLDPRDCIVVNDTQVVPARVTGSREATGGRWEGLFIREHNGLWEMLCQTRGKVQPGEWIAIEPGVRLRLVARTDDGHWLMEPPGWESVADFFARYGHVPLPPYIRGGNDETNDRQRYQTVYAARPGAVAAPTAGLHFTSRLIERLKQTGVEFVRLTLHVGLGTFQPIRHSLDSHVMHSERGEITSEAAEQIRRRRSNGGRVVAVGTTCVRSLETAAANGELQAWKGDTAIFIRPPYQFRTVDAMITNFHLPRTTLLALVYAFAGEPLCRAAYATAIRERYRFYSYGDAMLIL